LHKKESTHPSIAFGGFRNAIQRQAFGGFD